MAKFQKGNPGKAKGTENKIKKDARALFITIMEGEVDHIHDALEEIRVKDKARYLEILTKLFPYFIPKKLDLTTGGEQLQPRVVILPANGREFQAPKGIPDKLPKQPS